MWTSALLTLMQCSEEMSKIELLDFPHIVFIFTAMMVHGPKPYSHLRYY